VDEGLCQVDHKDLWESNYLQNEIRIFEINSLRLKIVEFLQFVLLEKKKPNEDD